MESRLSLYYQLDNDRGGIIADVNDLILKSKDHDNPFRTVRPANAYVHLFCSVAGGTGSGGVLTLAYLFRELLAAHRLNPIIIGNLVLPPLFYRKVRNRLHDDIRANGYAALKEIEWFMTLGYQGNPRMQRGQVARAHEDSLEFNFNPNSKPESGNTVVNRPPFDLVNLIDEPGEFSFREPNEIYPAIAGAAFVQLFSPILGQRESEEDNYYKKIKHLENGFSLNYGTYGLSMLVLPDEEILKYCELEMGRVLVTAMTVGAGDDKALRDQVFAAARVEIEQAIDRPSLLPKQHHVGIIVDAGLVAEVCGDDENRLKALDAAFSGQSGWKVGVKQRVADFADATLSSLRKRARRVGADWDVDSLIPSKPWGKDEVQQRLDDLTHQFRNELESRFERLARHVENGLDEARDGFYSAIGKYDRVSPITLRLALMAAREELSDYQSRPGPLEYRHEQHDVAGDVSGDVQTRAHRRVLEIIGVVDDDWNQVPNMLRDGYTEAAESARAMAETWCTNAIRHQLWAWLDEELQSAEESSSVVQLLLERIAVEARRALDRGEAGDQDFVLDAEVLRGLRTGRRYWDKLFSHLVEQGLVDGLYLDTAGDEPTYQPVASLPAMLGVKAQIDQAVAEAHALVAGTAGGANLVDESRLAKKCFAIVREHCRRQLVPVVKGKRQAGDDKTDKGLLVDDCVWLEAKWELEELFVRDHLVTYQVDGDSVLTPDERALRAAHLERTFDPLETDMEGYITEKLQFVCDKSRVLSRLRLTESSKVDPFVFVAVSSHYKDKGRNASSGEDRPALTDLIRGCHPLLKNARWLDGWTDEKRVAFFQAQAGLPVHNFWPVNGELKESYERIYREYVSGDDPNSDPIRDFPSHIDRNFEDPFEWDPHTVMPGLAPERVVSAGSASDRSFFELLAHGLIRPVETKAAKTDEQVAELIGHEIFGAPWKSLTESQRRRLTASLGRGRDAAKPNAPGGTWWVLHAESPAPDASLPMIMQDILPPFALALGERLDRAFYAFRSDFRKGNRRQIAHVDGLLAERRELAGLAEDPRAYAGRLEYWVEHVKSELADAQSLQEQGLRVSDYVRFLEGSINHLRALYQAYTSSDGA